jgi:hypothetical protein
MGLFRVLLLGFVVKFWWWIVGAAVLVGVCCVIAWLARQYADRRDARLAELAALVARADRQHAQVLAGDERGIFGEFPPAVGVPR